MTDAYRSGRWRIRGKVLAGTDLLELHHLGYHLGDFPSVEALAGYLVAHEGPALETFQRDNGEPFDPCE